MTFVFGLLIGLVLGAGITMVVFTLKALDRHYKNR